MVSREGLDSFGGVSSLKNILMLTTKGVGYIIVRGEQTRPDPTFYAVEINTATGSEREEVAPEDTE